MTRSLDPVAVPADGRRVLTFPEPLPGLGADRAFMLSPVDDHGALQLLSGIDTPALRLLVLPPEALALDYSLELTPGETEPIGGAHELRVLLIVSATGAASTATVNLMTPILFEPATGRARQVMLADTAVGVRAPVPVHAPTPLCAPTPLPAPPAAVTR